MPRNAIRIAPLLLALLPTAGRTASQPPDSPPNVVLIMTDDQGWFDLGANGNRHIATPNIDRLAAEGLRFTRFYAEPVCTPTRACLMTGRHYQRTGAIDTYMGRDVLDAREITLAQVFQQKGYKTGQFGKWHLGRYAKYHPNSRGFDTYFGFWQYGFMNRYFDSDELFLNREPVQTVGYITDVLTEAALGFLQRNRESPFFLYVPYNAPHSPYFAPDDAVKPYLEKGLPLQDAQIYGMVSEIDKNVGRLLKTLDDLDLREDTIVLFATDNGGVSHFEKLGLRANKGTVYEGGIRVPLIVRWPGQVPAGRTVDAMAHMIDLFPTFCEILDSPLPEDRPINGRSLLPIWRAGEGAATHRFLFHQWSRVRPHDDENWAIQDGRFKLVNGELYDLAQDPGESRNVAVEHPDRVRAMRSEFEKWFVDVTSGQTYARVSIEVGRDDENPVELDVTWAEPVGQAIKPIYRRYIRDAVTNWNFVGDSIRWPIEVVKPGHYEVSISYGVSPSDAGGRLRVSSARSSLEGTTEPTLGPDVFHTRTLGPLELKTGPQYLKVEATAVPGRELMTLHKLWLRRVDR